MVHESTKKLLDELKIHRREPYEEVILRLIEFYKKHSRQGIWIAKGRLKNPRRGMRSVIHGLWMVLTPRQSYTFKARDEVSILTLDGRRTYKLCYVERWHGRYEGWKPKEACLVLRDGRLWLKVVVENEAPHALDVLVDVNSLSYDV